MRRIWLWAAAALVLAAVAGGWAAWHRKANAPKPQAAAPTAPSEVSLSGKVEAQHVITVEATQSGVVEAMLVEVGQEVFEGQLLAQIKNGGLETQRQAAENDAERAQARVNQLESAIIAARLEASRAQADATRARGELDRLQRTYQRQQLLYREGATPRLTFEKAEREYQTAKAEADSIEQVAKNAEDRVATLTKDAETARQRLAERNEDLEAAKAQVAAGQVHSPVTGILVGRRAEAGAEVDPSMKDFLQIATDLTLLQITVEPPAPVLPRLRAGLPALVFLAEVPNGGLPGVVRAVKERQVVVEFNNPSPAVKPGLMAQVQIRLG